MVVKIAVVTALIVPLRRNKRLMTTTLLKVLMKIVEGAEAIPKKKKSKAIPTFVSNARCLVILRLTLSVEIALKGIRIEMPFINSLSIAE